MSPDDARPDTTPSDAPVLDEATRSARLLEAQAMAERLFAEIEATLLEPGRTELAVNDAIKALAHERLGVRRHWHKRIVRSGPNTVHPYRENPPDRVIEADDIVFLDLGPVFEDPLFRGWEADFGRTYVLGDDPAKRALVDALREHWRRGKERFDSDPAITGAELYAFMVEQAREAGYVFGGPIAGHLVGEFPHERHIGKGADIDIAPQNTAPLRGHDRFGRRLHWILEVHLVDPERGYGGFHEQLLTLPEA